LLLVDGPIPEMRVHLWTALAVSIPLGGVTMFLMALVVRARRRKSTTGAPGLIGAVGIARSPLMPEGKVFIQGELWNAVASADIPMGSTIRVHNVNGLVLMVEPVAAAQQVSSAEFAKRST